MLKRYWIFILLLVHLICSQKSYGQKSAEDLAQKYAGMGALSEVIMSNEFIIRNNFSLFFESNITKKEAQRTLIWYKLVFHQPCFISFTIIPNNETDRYELEIFKVRNNIKICKNKVDSIFTRVDSLAVDVVYNDNFQSAAFRGSLFNTRQIPIGLNEAVYILVHNLEGPDLGHVIDVQTCDYSYVLKVNKDKIEDESKQNRAELNTAHLRLKSIEKKICDAGDKKLGYTNFLGDDMGMKNYDSKTLDSASTAQANAVRKLDSLAGKPLPVPEPEPPPVVVPKKDTVIIPPKIPDPPKPIIIPKKEHFFSVMFAKNDSLKTDTAKVPKGPYLSNFVLKDSIINILRERLEKKDEPDKIKPKGPKKKKDLLNVYFSVVDATTKRAISYPELKFNKKNSTKKPNMIYIDSICSYSCKFLNSTRWLLRCDVFGFLPYEEYFDVNKCIDFGDDDLCFLVLITPFKKGDKLALPNVFFHPNSTVLKRSSYEELEKLLAYMQNNPVKIRIDGHTQGNNAIDNTGNNVEEEYQFKGSASKLSKKRAEKVYDYLVKNGIDKERLSIKGFAGRRPVVKRPKNKKDRELNMRVEIKIVDINKKYLKEKL